jgi:hypothetical protein
MEDLNAIRSQVMAGISKFENEVNNVYSTLVLPGWCGENHGYPQTLYGYVMGWFSHIDLLSAYWQGNDSNQTPRMKRFMNRYISPGSESNYLAIIVVFRTSDVNDTLRHAFAFSGPS